MSATPLKKERFWLPGSLALIAAFVAAGCGGGTPTPTPTGDISSDQADSSAGTPVGGEAANGGSGSNAPGAANSDMSMMMQADNGNDPAAEMSDPSAMFAQTGGESDPSAGIPGDPSAGIPGDPSAGIPGDPSAGIPGDPSTGILGDPSAGIPGAPSAGIPGDPSAGIPGDPSAGIPGDPSAGIPGDPTQAGDIRAGIGGPDGTGVGGGGQPKAPPEDSPAFPAFHLVMGLMQGKPADIGKYVGKRTTGELATIRTGKLSAKRAAELKTTFAKPTLIGQKRVSGGTQINLRSGEEVINITVKKEGGAFKVTDMKIRKSSKRR